MIIVYTPKLPLCSRIKTRNANSAQRITKRKKSTMSNIVKGIAFDGGKELSVLLRVLDNSLFLERGI